MKEVFTNSDGSQVGFYKSLLDEAGIACFIRNESSNPAAVPIPVFYPTLCVLNETDYERARAVLEDFQKVTVRPGGEWVCPHCQSKVPAGFDTCWNCERERPQG